MAIYSGETVNDAIEKGLKDLGIDKKHAKISVIQEPKTGILGKFRKEAKVEIIILTDADLEKKKKLIKSGIIGGVIVFFVIFLNMVFSGNSTSTVSSDNNELSVPIASSELATQNYESVVEQFKNAGFTNIKTTKMEDLITGWLTEDGSVEKVTINGQEDFESGEAFSNDVPIDIFYHTYPPETEQTDVVVDKESSAENSTSESSIENSINDTPEQAESSSSMEDKDSESMSEVTDKLQYTVTKKETQNIITGDVAMTGGDGTKVNVVISADNIKPGTYSATWTPGVFGGSDPGRGYGLIYINGDPNTIQIMPEESMVVTFNEGDTITFQFAGTGKNDRIRLIQE